MLRRTTRALENPERSTLKVGSVRVTSFVTGPRSDLDDKFQEVEFVVPVVQCMPELAADVKTG